MGLFSRTTPQRASNFDTELLPGETTVYVHGVSYRQSEIKKLGAGAHIFALVAEPTNPVDTNAVMVMGVKHGAVIHVGYLPAGEHSTLALRAPYSATTKKLVKAAT